MNRRYNDAMATIRRVPTIEHNFQLVITRVYEDGDQEFLEDEEESEPLFFLSFSVNLTHYFISQLMQSGSFLFLKNSSFEQERQRVVPASYGAICMAASMNFGNILHPRRMHPHVLSSRHACTGPCTSVNTRGAPMPAKTPILKNSFGSKWRLFCSVSFATTSSLIALLLQRRNLSRGKRYRQRTQRKQSPPALRQSHWSAIEILPRRRPRLWPRWYLRCLPWKP